MTPAAAWIQFAFLSSLCCSAKNSVFPFWVCELGGGDAELGIDIDFTVLVGSVRWLNKRDIHNTVLP
jgi:hypothetical protein